MTTFRAFLKQLADRALALWALLSAQVADLAKRFKFLLLLFVLLSAIGCTPAVQQADSDAPSPLTREKYDTVLVVLVDKSSSSHEDMKPGGKGIQFLNRAIKNYLQERAGSNDYLVVAKMDGSRQSILWQSHPKRISDEFANEKKWAEFLDKGVVDGSRVWDSLSDTLELVMTDPSMFNGRTRVVVLCLSDMVNNLVDSYTSEQRLIRNLTAFQKGKGIVGFFFVDQHEVLRWRPRLKEMGYKDAVVETRENGYPRLPTWD